MRTLSIGVAAVVAVGAGNVAFAQSRCDSTITKAAGKKAACKAGVISKAQKSGGAPDATRLANCEAKFAKACGNGRAAGDCVVQSGSCAGIEATVDACVTTLMGSAAPTTTTLPPVCGNGMVEPPEQCDGGPCAFASQEGCYPPGDPNECECCILTDGNCHPIPFSLPCCNHAQCLVLAPALGVCVPPSCTQPSDCPSPATCAAGLCCFPTGTFCGTGAGCCAGCNPGTSLCN
jgi:hypothetical protein